MLQMGSQDILKEPQPKRRKIQLACNKCRNRKTRCDGHRPACIACLERGLAADCTYEPNVSTSQRSITGVDGHAQQLERRAFGAAPESTGESPPLTCHKCVSLELSIRRDGSSPLLTLLIHEDNPDRNSYPGSDEDFDSTGRGTVFPSHSGTSNTAELLSSPTQTMHNTNDFDRVDGLATVAFPREDENLYGESSTIAFVRHVMHEQLPSEHQQYKSPAPEPIRDRDESLAVYPRRQTADDYVSSFWEFVHPVFPILHKASFMSRYKAVWSSEPYKGPHNTDQADEVAFSATLNLTFALGCQFSSLVAANKRVVVADEFYQRSRRIFIYDILDTSSMPVLQMLLLTGVYLQSTKYAERCWNTVGLAIRAAQTLGLHSESPTRRPERQLTREIRRRVWHVCVTLDRLLAMTFGRPAMITRSWDISIPLMIDDEFLQIDGDGHQPSNIPSRMGLFVYSLKLYDILDKILITFYIEPETLKPISTDDSLQKLLSNVLTFNRQLDGFHNSTPEYLRLPAKVAHSGLHINSNIQLQAQILSCRFLYTRVILLRPLLLLSAQSNLRPEATTPNLWNIAALDRELAGYACNLCVKSAQELVENLHHNIETPYRISPWHTVYLSFAAAVVLIAAQRCPIIDPLAKKEAFDLSLGYCVAILAHHEPQIHSACQAIRVLQKLRNQMKNFQTQNAIDYGTNRESPNNSSSATNAPPETGIEHFAEPSQDWWNEFIPNGTEINSETWYSQHLINLDWLDIS